MRSRKVDPLNASHKFPYWESVATEAEIEAARRMCAGDPWLLDLLGI